MSVLPPSLCASLTPSVRLANLLHRLKLKRPQAAKKFRSQLDELYSEALADPKQKARL